MTDLFLDPKVLDFQADKYELILMTLRWAKMLKAKGTPEPMNVLIEKALKEIIEKRVTKEEILAQKIPSNVSTEEIPAVVDVGGEGRGGKVPEATLEGLVEEGDELDGDGKKKKKKAKKKSE